MILADKTLVNFDLLGRETPGIGIMLLTTPCLLEIYEEELLAIVFLFYTKAKSVV